MSMNGLGLMSALSSGHPSELAIPFARERLPLALLCTLGLAAAPAQGIEEGEKDKRPVELDGVTVVADRDSPVGPDTGYTAKRTLAGTKTDTPLNEIPRSISITTEQQMRDRNVSTVSDALHYTAGVQTDVWGQDNRADWFIIRGFSQGNNGLYRDGNRVHSDGHFRWQTDPFLLERVEVLKGAASVLYGQNPPGGVVNLVTKRPTATRFGKIGVEYGSFDHKQMTLDMGGPLDDAGRILYRITALSWDKGNQVDHVNEERLLFAPTLTFNFTDDTTLTLRASMQRDNSDPTMQYPLAEGTRFRTANGKIHDDVAVGDPHYEKFERDQYTFGYEFQQRFNDAWSFQQNLRYGHLDLEYRHMYATSYLDDLQPGADPSRRLLMRGLGGSDGQSDSISVDNRLLYKWEGAWVQSTLLMGLDYQKLDVDNKRYARDPLVLEPIDIYNPRYGGQITLVDWDLNPVTDADRQDFRTRFDQFGLYLQEQVKLDDHWVFLLGGRYDKARADLDNRTTDVDKSIRDEEFTWNAGVAYLFDNGLTPYFSYSEFFLPVADLNTRTGEPFEPEEGEQWEVGLKYQPPGFDGSFNLALFEMTQSNVRTSGAGGITTQLGEVRSKGIEFEAVANVTERLSLVGSMTYLDMETTKSLRANERGKTPSSVADRMASLWATYTFRGGPLGGLALGAGARYTGESWGDNTETLEVPSRTLYDAMASYTWRDLKLQLNASNLTDKEYVSSCSYYCYYGERRNVTASLTYSW
ncbi:TonB-dependent siderophore receptor [Azotobacter armeniacus]